jgi:hypothetical protein
MAEPKPLLRKNGRLARIGGKLVRSDAPELCPCCDVDPPCECNIPALFITKVEWIWDRPKRRVTVEWTYRWGDDLPPACAEILDRLQIVFDVNQSEESGLGPIEVRIPKVTPGEGKGAIGYPIEVLCELETRAIPFESVIGRVIDVTGICPPSLWSNRAYLGPVYVPWDEMCAAKRPCENDIDCIFWYRYSTNCGVLGPFESPEDAAAAAPDDSPCDWTGPSEVAGFCCGRLCYPYRLTCTVEATFPVTAECRDYLSNGIGDSSACCKMLAMSAVAGPNDTVICSSPFNPCSNDNVKPVIQPGAVPDGYEVIDCVGGRGNPLP